jgi:AcrR family transcriptional regulator
MLNAARKPRPYRQTARALAVSAAEKRMLEAFLECARERWFEEVTLEEVARRAGVSVRTVIRRYGGKEGLVVAAANSHHGPNARRMRAAPPGDVEAIVAALVRYYECYGDEALRMLAQAPRYPTLAPLIEFGRRDHRLLVAEAFAPQLARMSQRRYEEILDALVVACDVYVWQVARRDMERSIEATRALIARMVRGILQGSPRGV